MRIQGPHYMMTQRCPSPETTMSLAPSHRGQSGLLSGKDTEELKSAGVPSSSRVPAPLTLPGHRVAWTSDSESFLMVTPPPEPHQPTHRRLLEANPLENLPCLSRVWGSLSGTHSGSSSSCAPQHDRQAWKLAHMPLPREWSCRSPQGIVNS